jgi:hypothetical protein
MVEQAEASDPTALFPFPSARERNPAPGKSFSGQDSFPMAEGRASSSLLPKTVAR